jgi:hypothetical protein
LHARNRMVSAISCGVAARLTGTVSRKSAFPSPPPVKRLSISVSTGPGATALTRTPLGAPSSAAAEQRAEHIGIKHGGIALRRLLGDRAWMALGAGIVDCHVKPPEALDGLIDQVPHVVVMADIGADEFSLSTERAELLGELCARVAVAAGDDDLIAFIGKGQGRSAAQVGSDRVLLSCGSLQLARPNPLSLTPRYMRWSVYRRACACNFPDLGSQVPTERQEGIRGSVWERPREPHD